MEGKEKLKAMKMVIPAVMPIVRLKGIPMVGVRLQCFGANDQGLQSHHHQKTAFFAQKKQFFWPKTAFWGHDWSVVGPHTLF